MTNDLLQRLDEAANDTHYIDHLTASEAADRIRKLEAQIAALVPQPVAVRVKPLVWEGLGENHWRSKTPFPFTIRAENYGAGFAVGWSVPGFSDVFVPWRFASIESAKAAAQADYAARILAAIEAVPASVVRDSALDEAARFQPTEAQLASAAMSYDHSFGLMRPDKQKALMFSGKYWLNAWQHEFNAMKGGAK